jgi:hypothetical protein
MDADMEIDMEKLLGMHRMKFPISTPLGNVVLRALPNVVAKRVNRYLESTYPDYEGVMDALHHLKKISDFHEAQGKEPVLNLDQARELAALTAKAAPYMDHYSVECFVTPKMTCPDDILALADALPHELWMKIATMLVVLSNPMPIQEKHFQFLRLCKDYGITISEDLTAEVMTVHQAYALEEANRLEAIESKKLISEVLGHG